MKNKIQLKRKNWFISCPPFFYVLSICMYITVETGYVIHTANIPSTGFALAKRDQHVGITTCRKSIAGIRNCSFY